jgi:integrase
VQCGEADGALVHPNNWSKKDFKGALRRAGLPPTVRLYGLRHSMATLALEAGVHPKVVSERLGHSTTQLTLDTDSLVSPHMQDRASESLADLIYRQREDADRAVD